MKKYIINLLFLIVPLFGFGQTVQEQFAGFGNISSVTSLGSSNYTVVLTGFTGSPRFEVNGTWDGSDVAVGNVIFRDGARYVITLVNSSSAGGFNVRVNSPDEGLGVSALNNGDIVAVGAEFMGLFPMPRQGDNAGTGIPPSLASSIEIHNMKVMARIGAEYITTDSFSTFISSAFTSVSFSDVPIGAIVLRKTLGNFYQKTSSTAMTQQTNINGANTSTIFGVTGNTLNFSARLNAHIRLNTTGNPTTATINTPIYNSASSVSVGSEYLIGITTGTNSVTVTWDTIYGLYNKDSGFSNLGTTFVPAQSTVEYKFRVVVGAAETIRLQLTDNVGTGSGGSVTLGRDTLQQIFSSVRMPKFQGRLLQKQQVRIGFIGTSNTADDSRFCAPLRTKMREAGFIVSPGAGNVAQGGNPAIAYTAGWTTTAAGLNYIGYFASRGTTADTARWTTYSNDALNIVSETGYFDTLIINTANTGAFTLRIDNAIVATTSVTGYRVDKYPLTRGNHRWSISVTSGTVDVLGCYPIDSQADVAIWNYGAGGQGVKDIKNLDSLSINNQVSDLGINLCFIEHGTNDYASSTAAIYMANMRTFYRKLTGNGKTDVVIEIPIQGNGATVSKAYEYRDSLLAFTKQKQINYVSLFDFHGLEATAVANAVYDGVHYITPKAGSMHGNLFFKFLTQDQDISHQVIGDLRIEGDKLGVGGMTKPLTYALEFGTNKGLRFQGWNTANRPTTLNTGIFGWNTSLTNLEWYNGSAWIQPVGLSANGASDQVARFSSTNALTGSGNLSVTESSTGSILLHQSTSKALRGTADHFGNYTLEGVSSSTSGGLVFLGKRSLGSVTTPTNLTITDGMVFSKIGGQGYVGAWREAAYIEIVGDGTIGGSYVPAGLNFFTTNSAGNTLRRAKLGASGSFLLGDYSATSNGFGTYQNQSKLDVNGSGAFYDTGTLASESLTNGSLTSGTSWTATNDCTLTANAATWTFSTGTASTLTQTSGTLAIATKGSRKYRFAYTVSAKSGTITTFQLTTTTGLTAIDLTQLNGNYIVYFTSAASPSDFVIAATLASGTTFTLDNLSLREVTGGDVIVAGKFTGGGTNGLKIDGAGSVTSDGTITVPALAYNAGTWDGNNTVPTRDDIRDKLESLGLSGTPWLLGGQNITANSNIGSNDAFRVGIQTNGTARVYFDASGRMVSGTLTDINLIASDSIRFKGNTLDLEGILKMTGVINMNSNAINNASRVSADSVDVLNPSFQNTPTFNYQDYTATGTLNRELAHYWDGTTDDSLTTNVGLPDESLFFVKNKDNVLLLTVLPGAGHTISGDGRVYPNEGVWFQKHGTVIERITPFRKDYYLSATPTTNGSGEFTITHNLGTTSVVTFAQAVCDACNYTVRRKSVSGITTTQAVFVVRDETGATVNSTSMSVDVSVIRTQ